MKSDQKRIVVEKEDPSRHVYTILLRMAPADIGPFTMLVESHGHLAIPRTIDPKLGVLELLTAPDYIEETRQIINGIAKEIDLELICI